MSDLLSRLQSSLAGRYSVERELGRGGMATVFLARDEKHGRRVALKVFSSDISVALGAERFQREIEIASSLTHPHIVPLYDSGEADGCLFYAMPYIEGESLRTRLDRERQLPLDEAIRITCEIASALDYAHRKGVLHRDVKPANILLEDGHAVIADFGIARAISRAAEHDRMTMTGVTLGTPTYMSPEQASGEQTIDGRSDIYALACVLYEMLVGQPPFTGPNAQAVMARHAMETVPSIRIVRGTIPEEVEEAILCALSKAPADRFATAQQFADALGGMGTGMTRRFTTTRAAAKRQRDRRVTAVALSAFVALTALGSLWWAVNRPTNASAVTGGSLIAGPIAVTYFVDGGRGEDLGYFADALTESLIEKLAAIDGLDVISRNGMALFKGSTVGADSIGRAFHAGMVVMGDVEDRGDNVRVSVRLLDGQSGAPLESDGFDVPKLNLLAASDSLATQVSFWLRARLGEHVQFRQDREGTSSPEAWLLVQRAERARKDALAFMRADSLAEGAARFGLADTLLAQAEALDPAWTRPIVARAELALDEFFTTRERLREPEIIARGLGHAERALARDSMSAAALEARGTLRYYKLLFGWAPDPDEAAFLLRTAEADLTRATSIARNRASAWSTLSLLLYRKYDRQGASQAAFEAYDADAYLRNAAEILFRLYTTTWDLEQFKSAATWCQRGRERFPQQGQFIRCSLWILTTPLGSPDPDAAWRLVDSLELVTPESRRPFMRRYGEMIAAVVIDRAGLADSARRVIERARAGPEIDPEGELMGHEIVVRAMLRDDEEALRLLDRYLTAHPDHREGFTHASRWEFRRLRDDPRFLSIVQPGG